MRARRGQIAASDRAANEGGGQGFHLSLEPPLSLASTNAARSWTKAEHVGHAQDFPPPLWAAATVLL